MDSESTLIEMLNCRRYTKSLHIPLNFIDIVWSSFDEYLKYLGTFNRKRKKGVRREVNKNRREGTVVEQLCVCDEHVERLHQLLDMNSYKHNGRRFSFSRSFFLELQSNLGDNVTFYVSWKAGILTGVSVCLRRNGMIHLPMIGVDHARTGNDYTYFCLGYYKPMMDAVLNGTTRFYAGRGMYATKARRGFRRANLYIYYRDSTRTKNMVTKPWLALLSEWNRGKVRRLTGKNRQRKALRL